MVIKWECLFKRYNSFRVLLLYDKKPFDFVLSIDEKTFNGVGSFGQDALWLPLNKSEGIKIIRSVSNIDKVSDNVKYIKSIHSEVFPEIMWVEDVLFGDTPCVITKMENVIS